jgi:hypothetical protein
LTKAGQYLFSPYESLGRQENLRRPWRPQAGLTF